MALSGKPAPTGIQVGIDVYFIYNNVPQKAKVVGTSSEVTNPNGDSVGKTKVIYSLEGYNKGFTTEEIFPTPVGLIEYFASLLQVSITIPDLGL